MGNYHEQFLGGGEVATSPCYPTDPEHDGKVHLFNLPIKRGQVVELQIHFAPEQENSQPSLTAQRGSEEIVLPGFVVLELFQGCRDKVEQERVERRVAQARIVWPSAIACTSALQTYARFHLSHTLGFIDALIDHTATELSMPLYTFNVKHYEVVPGLTTTQPS